MAREVLGMARALVSGKLVVFTAVLAALAAGCDAGEQRALQLARSLVACEEAGDAACVEQRLDLDRRARTLLGPVYGDAAAEQRQAFRKLLARVVIQGQGLRQREFQGAPGDWETAVGPEGLVQVRQWAPGRRFAYIYDVDPAAGLVRERNHEREGQRAEAAVVVARFRRDWQEANGREPVLEDYLKDFEGYLQGRRLRTWKVPGRG